MYLRDVVIQVDVRDVRSLLSNYRAWHLKQVIVAICIVQKYAIRSHMAFTPNMDLY